MPEIRVIWEKPRRFFEYYVSPFVLAVGGWLTIMSGAVSVALPLFFRWLPGFMTLTYVALWVLVIQITRANWKLVQRLRTKIRVNCGPEVAGSVAPATLRIVNGDKAYLLRCKFFRMSVEAITDEPLRGCKGLLVRIDKGPEKRWGDDNAVITFAPGEDDDATAKTLHGGVTEYLDVILITESNEIMPATKNRQWRFKHPAAIFSEHGAYYLTVQLTGDEMPSKTIRLRFMWTGSWETSGLVMAD